MRRLALISILLVSVLAIASSTMAQSPANTLQNRMVVFEAFMNPG